MPSRWSPLIALGMGVGLTIWLSRRSITLVAADFFRPDLVADITVDFPQNEDDFILAAWNYVAGIPYEAIGSDIYVQENIIECADCYLPATTLERRIGNCLAKSALLASILMTRLPAEYVHIIIGSYKYEEIGGHAWTEVYRDGAWYLLESTREPNMLNPWLLADDSYPLYDPAVLITSNRISCEDEKYCTAIANCDCSDVANSRNA